MYSQIIKSETVFNKIEIGNEWNINFPQYSPLDIQHTFSSEFSIGWSTFEIFLVIFYETAGKKDIKVATIKK